MKLDKTTIHRLEFSLVAIAVVVLAIGYFVSKW